MNKTPALRRPPKTGLKTGRYDYGMLPQDLFEAIRKGVLERHAAKTARTQRRD